MCTAMMQITAHSRPVLYRLLEALLTPWPLTSRDTLETVLQMTARERDKSAAPHACVDPVALAKAAEWEGGKV